jgi:hypothetical protein
MLQTNLEGSVQLYNVAVSKATMQPDLPDQLHFVQLSQLVQVIHLDSQQLARLSILCL